MEFWKDIFNIVFFLSLSIVAILSYIQARKTLFSPIRTEIFKLQIELFQEVLSGFNKHSSTDFDDEFGFQEILEINALEMQHAYIKTFFSEKVKPNDELLERLRKATYGMIIREEDSEKYIEVITPGSELIEAPNDKQKELDPALKLAKWNEYDIGAVQYTKKYHDKLKEFSKIS